MQQRVYDYIEESIALHGYAPSVREIGEALGLKSPSTVHFHIKHLQEMGLIEKKKLNFTLSTSKPGTQKETDSRASNNDDADPDTDTDTENDDE